MLKYSIGYFWVPHFSRVFPGMSSMSGIKGKLDISGLPEMSGTPEIWGSTGYFGLPDDFQNRKGSGWVSKIMLGCRRVLGSCWVLVRSFSWKIISCV